MKKCRLLLFYISFLIFSNPLAPAQTAPSDIQFVRQGVKRVIFDPDQSIPLARLEPANIVGMASMHPVTYHTTHRPEISVKGDKLVVESSDETESSIWFGGFNPFSTYFLDAESLKGDGEIGFEFANSDKTRQFFVTAQFNNNLFTDIRLKVVKNSTIIENSSIATNIDQATGSEKKIILQMLGSGLVVYLQGEGLPLTVAQSDFNQFIDLRQKEIIGSFQSSIYLSIKQGSVTINRAESAITTGVGLADIRAITYENGDPFLDKGRLWYTMSIRGRALPHHIQGVFSMDPTVFDVSLEGIILFDRNDGILRNEIASHIFYDRNENIWRGLTTGFSAFANPESEKKELLAVESNIDPRFGFSTMRASPIGMVGDIEDPHLIFDDEASKWRMLTCENIDGYKAIVLESDHWDRDFTRIAGPVAQNSTGTSIQKIDGQFYCFSGSSEREIFIYSYPFLEEMGTLKMDLPPWDSSAGTRVWPNVVQLPEGYPFKYVALMMDRYNFPGHQGPHWSYGAIYLYYGFE